MARGHLLAAFTRKLSFSFYFFLPEGTEGTTSFKISNLSDIKIIYSDDFDKILTPLSNTVSPVFLHSSQFQGLCLTKSSSETLQNLPHFVYTKTQSFFFHFSFRATLVFSKECPGLPMSTLEYIFQMFETTCMANLLIQASFDMKKRISIMKKAKKFLT